MKLEVSKEAAAWYKQEMDLKDGDYVQFFPQLYFGIATMHPSYYLGVNIVNSNDIAIKDEKEGITFYFNHANAWFLQNYEMSVVVENDDIHVIFTPDN